MATSGKRRQPPGRTCRAGGLEGRALQHEDLVADPAGTHEGRLGTPRTPRRPAVEVIGKARALDDGGGLVFPSAWRPGEPMSDMSLTKVLRDVGLADRATVHGFRTSFRTWAAERTNADHALMELSPAHAVGSVVEQAYARIGPAGEEEAADGPVGRLPHGEGRRSRETARMTASRMRLSALFTRGGLR